MQPVRALPILDGKYELLRQLGEGGMGAVYEAVHRGTARHVAVKLITAEAHKSREAIQRFRREAMATGPIESQYIAHALDTGVDAATGSPYLVMDLLKGEDLFAAIGRLGPLPPELVLRVAAQTCLGLEKAHQAGVIHRDIKPGNLFLTRREGSEVIVKLLDFGIAKATFEPAVPAAHADLTATGAMLGSPMYVSPEQARGMKTIDHRTDIWSLGVVMYEALSGLPPHARAETLGDLIFQICGTPAPSIQQNAPWVPSGVAAIVHRALALDPSARFASAREMGSAIRALLPNGHALDESMFSPLSAEARSVQASRHSIPGDVRAPLPSMSGPSVSAATSGPLTVHTTTGFAQTALAPSSRRSRVGLIAAGGALLAATTAAGGFMLTRRVPAAPVAADAPVVAAAIPAPPEVTGALSATAPPSADALVPPPIAGTPGPSPSTHSRATGLSPARSATHPPPRATSKCDPPYFTDAKGARVFKKECL